MKHFTRGLAVVLCPWLQAAWGAGDPAREVGSEIARIADAVKEIRANPSLDQDTKLVDKISFASRNQRIFLLYYVLREQWGAVVTPTDITTIRAAELAAAEEARTDVQAGATASASGSTSLISKGSAPGSFGVSVENGALIRSVGGATTTVQGNLIGILDTLASKGLVVSYNDDGGVTRFLRRFSFAFTLKNGNPQQETPAAGGAGGAPTGITDTIRRQLSGYDRRLEQYGGRAIVGRNRRDPRDAINRSAIADFMRGPAQDVMKAFDEALETLQASNDYDAWVSGTIKELKSAPLPLLEGALVGRMNILCDLAKRIVPDFYTRALAGSQAYAIFIRARSRLLESIEKKKLFVVEYVNTRQALQADLSTYRFIGEGQKGHWDLTFNTALTGYNHTPAGGGSRFRDFQLAGEAARALGSQSSRGQSKSPVGNAVLAAGFLYERLSDSATVTFGGRNLIAPKGNLYIGQVRITIPVKNSGVKIPLSLSVSNRTELLSEKQVRANLGFTFNFDSVGALLKK